MKEGKTLTRLLTARYAFSVAIILGVVYIYVAFSAIWQITSEYLQGNLFDASQAEFLFMLFFFITPISFTGAYILKLVAREWKFEHFTRYAFIDEQYESQSSPLESSMLYQAKIGPNQISALLAEMVSYGYLKTKNYYTYELSHNIGLSNLGREHRYVIDNLFHSHDKIDIRRSHTARNVLRTAASLVMERLEVNGSFTYSKFETVLLKFLAVFFFIALIFSFFFFKVFLTNPDILFNITERTYVIETWQIYALIPIVLFVFGLPIHELIRKDYTPKGQELRKEALGLRLFVKQVYRERFFSKSSERLSADSDFNKYYPYAVGFGLEQRIQKYLS